MFSVGFGDRDFDGAFIVAGTQSCGVNVIISFQMRGTKGGGALLNLRPWTTRPDFTSALISLKSAFQRLRPLRLEFLLKLLRE